MAIEGIAGKVALVTGAQQGIGRAIAIALGAAGADVAINYLDQRGAADEVAEAVRSFGVRALTLQCDVRDPTASAAMVRSTVSSFGRLELLVNNAGVFPRASFVEITERDWDYVVDTNLKGAFFCAQAAAREMISAGLSGNIINVASRAITGTSQRGTHYAASKGGMAALTRAMAMELASYGIRVNAIAPGLTDTAQPRGGSTEDELLARARQLLGGRMGLPEDIAAVTVFLASDASSFMFGQTLHVNGGAYMSP